MRNGHQWIYVLLRQEGWVVNHKKVHRIQREEGLNLCTRRLEGKLQLDIV